MSTFYFKKYILVIINVTKNIIGMERIFMINMIYDKHTKQIRIYLSAYIILKNYFEKYHFLKLLFNFVEDSTG